jgi:hypothetical protein
MDFHLKKDTQIYVAGHKGLISSAFIRFFERNHYTNIINRYRKLPILEGHFKKTLFGNHNMDNETNKTLIDNIPNEIEKYWRFQ